MQAGMPDMPVCLQTRWTSNARSVHAMNVRTASLLHALPAFLILVRGLHLPPAHFSSYVPTAFHMDRYSSSSSRRKTVRTETTLRPTTSSARSRQARHPEASYQWIFRSNIPRRRGLYLPNDIHKRNFFGLGEVIGVLAKPSETLRSLTEAKSMLEQTRNELTEARERAQLTPTHTFSPLPSSIFFSRPAEVRTIENLLNGEPSWTVVFGGSSTGKTAILRSVLSQSRYHVLHFDLRIPGFADLTSLYTSLSQQMEQFFTTISETMDGYGEFEKEAWSFKHDRLNTERRLNRGLPTNYSTSTICPLGQIRTCDIARLMEMFQSSLLKYREFEPFTDDDGLSDTTRVSPSDHEPKKRPFWKRRGKDQVAKLQEPEKSAGDLKQEKPPHVEKRVPVVFFDEAHKLPALVHSTGTMKCLLDAMLVLTKQDRLCHVIHATSEPFYQTWLRRANVIQHCKIITIGDCTKSEMRAFFRDRIIPQVPERLRAGLVFHQLYEAFGGKLAHWQDYVTDYVNANGKLDIKQSSHFLQAHALLNLHIIHSSESTPEAQTDRRRSRQMTNNASASVPNLHGGAGYRIYSPLTTGLDNEDEPVTPDFTATDLIKVVHKLTESENGVRSLPYFPLCREIGVKAVDGMVRGKILDLRWTDLVRNPGGIGVLEAPVSSTSVFRPRGGAVEKASSIRSETHRHYRPESNGTMVNGNGAVVDSEEGMIVPPPSDIGDVSPVEGFPTFEGAGGEDVVPDDDYVGPKLLPATPIMGFAMREVAVDYLLEDDSVSEYASLSDVNEY